jgi:hypothetical protein
MKTMQQTIKKIFIIGAVATLASVVFMSCSKDEEPAVDNRPYTISGNATGSQVVPAVPDSGTATITGTYNPQTGVLNYTSNWTNLSGGPVSAGFYGGASGASGIAVGTGWTLSGGSTGTVTGNITLSESQAAQLMAGNLYYTFSTTNRPSGEVRGQITATR